jgi:hypothetical protein
MKSTTNSIQRAYMVAKALVDTLEAEEQKRDHQYIIDHNIVNPDGSIPEYVWCIDDEEAFSKANEELGKIEVESGLQDKFNVAREALKIAEEKLIKYGLSLAPTHEREVLTKAVKENYKVREKVLDLALRLDVSTVTR